jgi:aryl-alcohol dehydrogenase-like predicted oxidoreductase
MAAWQFAKAQAVAERNGWTRFVSMQNHYNLLYREEEREMIPLCVDQGVAVVPYSPLARGFLARRPGSSGSTRSGSDPVQDDLYGRDEDVAVVRAVAAVADERSVPAAQVAIAWLLHQPAVTAPIVGATSVDHIEVALAATELSLTDEDVAALERSYRPHPISREEPS